MLTKLPKKQMAVIQFSSLYHPAFSETMLKGSKTLVTGSGNTAITFPLRVLHLPLINRHIFIEDFQSTHVSFTPEATGTLNTHRHTD